MSVLSPADVAELSFVVSDLSFGDAYRLCTTGPVIPALLVDHLDAQGNRVVVEVEIESGFCRLIESGNQAQTEILIATGLGWTKSYTVLFDSGSLVTADCRVYIGDRVFHVGAVSLGGVLGLWQTAVCEERSR